MPRKEQPAKNLRKFISTRRIPLGQLAKWLGVKVSDLKDDLPLTPERVEKLKASCQQGWK